MRTQSRPWALYLTAPNHITPKQIGLYHNRTDADDMRRWLRRKLPHPIAIQVVWIGDNPG